MALEEVLGKKVNLRDHLELDLGLDSLTRIELLLALQERLNLKVSDEDNMDFFLCQTVEELLNQFKKFIPAASVGGKEQNVLQWNEVLKEMPAEVTLKKIKTSFAWWEIAVNVFFIAVFKVFFKMFFFLRVEGRNHLPPAGPYIICANHTTYLDGLIIFSALPYKTVLNTYFVGYSAILEKGLIQSFIKIGRLIPISVSFNLMEAFKACSFVLRHSKVLCYFPEGQRSIDGKLNEFKKGIGILVKELNVPVVPAYIDGAFNAWPRGRRFPKMAPIKVKFGPMLTSRDLGAEDPAVEKSRMYKHIAKNLQQHISQSFLFSFRSQGNRKNNLA
jgi:long-chain acyl-CoA synthetase